MMSSEDEHFLATSLGGMWSIENPDVADVHIVDIGAGLSRNCRYGGQLRSDRDFYSVAEHSALMLAYMVDQLQIRTMEEALCVLFHDASEAFLGDMSSPLKDMIPLFKEIEDRSQAVIYDAIGVRPVTQRAMKASVKHFDLRIRIDEREALILEPALTIGLEKLWRKDGVQSPLNVKIHSLLPAPAKKMFDGAVAWCIFNLDDPTGAILNRPAHREFIEALPQGYGGELPDLGQDAEVPEMRSAYL